MKAMNSKSRRVQHGVVVALLMALWTMGTGAHAAYAAAMVPINGSFSGTAIFTGPATVQFSGEGNASQLGRSHNSGLATTTGQGAACPDGPTGLPNTNVETLTAANGDNLVIVSQDVACPIAPNVYHGTGQWVVDGADSTGRFSGATGAGTLDGIGHFDVGTFSFQITGQISAPK
jgi:hypothetical protein